MKLFQRDVVVPLPQDVDVDQDDSYGVPDARKLPRSAAEYAAMHDRALRDGSRTQRATACWGLIARGMDSLPWVDGALTHSPLDDPDHAELLTDAVAVLVRVGIPPTWATRLRAVAHSPAVAGTPAGDILSDYFDRLDAPRLSAPDQRTATER